MGNHKSNFSKFMLLWSGEFISAIGSGLTSFGLRVYVFRQTGSAASMGLVTLLAFLPTLLFSVPAGVLAGGAAAWYFAARRGQPQPSPLSMFSVP